MLFTAGGGGMGWPRRERGQGTPLKETARQVFPAVSSMHQRADQSRKIIRINEVIRSLLSISHMQRMDLIAINNRSLCNHSKVQRATRTTRKLKLNPSQNLPDTSMLRLDYRRRRSLKTEQFKEKGQCGERERVREEIETEVCQQYIEEYLQKLREEKRFDILGDRTRLIEQACKQIIARVEAQRKKPFPNISTPNNPLPNLNGNNLLSGQSEAESIQIRELRLPDNIRKARSITEVEYSDELNRIRRSSEYSSKARALNQRMFLRKIRQIKMGGQPE